MDQTTIVETPEDGLAAILDIYPEAFPEEELRPLVEALLPLPEVLSLTAICGGAAVGHGLFSLCDVGCVGERAALLGPLAIRPDFQRRGLGGAIIEAGRARMAARGVPALLVLGDPAYYGRFGFEPETEIAPPYPLPDAWRPAWRSLRLEEGPASSGVLAPPAPWRRPELWS